jgi:tyrosyl-tRNA synthetase
MAGCEVIVLIADLHAYLDNMKSSWEQLEARTKYYMIMIQQMLTCLKVDLNKIHFVKGTSFQLTPEYSLNVYKTNAIITLRDAKHSGADVVKQSDNPIMNSLLYPSLQCLDMQYLKANAFLGGVD